MVGGGERTRGWQGTRLVVAVLVGAGVLATGVAIAATGDLTPAECYDDTTNPIEACIDVDGLDGAAGIAISPDGSSLYLVSRDDATLVHFDRNTTTGVLTFQECFEDAGKGTSCEDVDGLHDAIRVTISPDGSSVYVVTFGDDDAVLHFDRDQGGGLSHGDLTLVECFDDTTNPVPTCDDVEGLDGAHEIIVSPDGLSAYLASQNDDAVVHFDRDPANGRLSFKKCFEDLGKGTSCEDVDGLNTARGVAIPPDGASVYIGSTQDDSLVNFDRDTGGGATHGDLTFNECFDDSTNPIPACTDVDGLDGALGVAASGDDKSIYVTAFQGDAVVNFDRNPSNGHLTPSECFDDVSDPYPACTTTDGLNGATAATVSVDGASLYVLSFTGDSFVNFDRDTGSGELTPSECFEDVGKIGDVCTEIDGLDVAHDVRLPIDDSSVYVASLGDDAVLRFQREPLSDPPPDTTAPGFSLKGKKTQRRAGHVRVRVAVDESATLEGSGRIRIPASRGQSSTAVITKTKLRPTTKEAAAGDTVLLKLALKRSARKLTRRAHEKGRFARAKLTIAGTDASGNEKSKDRKIKLKRKRR